MTNEGILIMIFSFGLNFAIRIQIQGVGRLSYHWLHRGEHVGGVASLQGLCGGKQELVSPDGIREQGVIVGEGYIGCRNHLAWKEQKFNYHKL